MKFSTLDQSIQDNSWNTLDLIHFDQIKENTKEDFPCFIVRWQYIKTITKFPWVDFFNLTVKDQEERVRCWSMFLASLKIPTQVLVISKEIDTNKYIRETLLQVEKSPYLTDEVKKRIIKGLPQTLDYIKSDWETSPFKKEYYIITSCKMWFMWNLQEDTENEKDTTIYQLWQSRKYNDREWAVFTENFNIYYQESMQWLSTIMEEDRKFSAVATEEEAIWLFAELNNDITMGSITDIKSFL